jgi:hypothetical protein
VSFVANMLSRSKRAPTVRFENLPSHILDKIVGELIPNDRLRLSTCHSTLALYDYVDGLDATPPFDGDTMRSVFSYFVRRPNMLKSCTIDDDTNTFETLEETDQLFLPGTLFAGGQQLEYLKIRGTSIPQEYILANLPRVQTAILGGAPYKPDFGLDGCKELHTLVLESGLDDDGEDGDGIAEFGGIGDAPALKHVTVENQHGFLCLCGVVPLRETLESLCIVGTETHSEVITIGNNLAADHIDHLHGMSKMRHLTLDSATAFFSKDILLSMPLLETLDLSHRHRNADWTSIPDSMVNNADITADFFDAVKELQHLKNLGCRDVRLTHAFEAPTVEVMHVSPWSLRESISAGFTFERTPALQKLVIDGAFTSGKMDASVSQELIDLFRGARTLEVVMKTSPTDRLSEMIPTWFRIAQSVPHIVFSME